MSELVQRTAISESATLANIDRLGVDIGRVIIGGITDGNEPSMFDADTFLEVPEVDGAIESLRELRGGKFGAEIQLVSKCGATVQRRTLDWLEEHKFFGRTGISPDNIHFCSTRPEKGPIAARLGLTHFVDDRPDVLLGMPASVRQRVLFVPNGEPLPAGVAGKGSKHFVIAHGWNEANLILKSRFDGQGDSA